MEVILKSNIEKLGAKDEVVVVKPGYARNYLIPRGYAIAATESAKKMLSENLKQRAHKETKILAEAQATADKLGALEVKVGAVARDQCSSRRANNRMHRNCGRCRVLDRSITLRNPVMLVVMPLNHV